MILSSHWVLGMGLSIIGGAAGTWAFLWLLRRSLSLPAKPELTAGARRVPPWLTGAVERTFFTVLVGLEVAGTPTAMIGWLALKLATNWNHPEWKDQPNARTFALTALLGGLVSMFFALIGGMVCAGALAPGK